MHTHTPTHAGLYTYTYTHTCIHLMRAHLQVYRHAPTLADMHIRKHAYALMCMHRPYMHADYTLIHMHRCTHMFQPLHGAAGKVRAVVTIKPCECPCPRCMQELVTPSCNNQMGTVEDSSFSHSFSTSLTRCQALCLVQG